MGRYLAPGFDRELQQRDTEKSDDTLGDTSI